MSRLLWLCLLSGCGLGIAPIDKSVEPCVADADCAAGWLCHEDHCLRPPAACNGDGWRNPSEECDDGNQVDEDGCTNNCRIARCGDGILRRDQDLADPSTEECEPGLEPPAVRCSEDCRLLPPSRRIHIDATPCNAEPNVYQDQEGHGRVQFTCEGLNWTENDAMTCVLDGDAVTCFGALDLGRSTQCFNSDCESGEWTHFPPITRRLPMAFDWLQVDWRDWYREEEGGPILPGVDLQLARGPSFYEAKYRPYAPEGDLVGLDGPNRYGFSSISVVAGTTCWTRDDGRLFCTGQSSCGLIEPQREEYRKYQGEMWWRRELPPVLQVAMNHAVACAALRDGRVICWGDLEQFNLPGVDCEVHPNRIMPDLEEVVAVESGYTFMLALHRDGGVSQWGWNWDRTVMEPPTRLRLPERAVQVTTASRTGCALLESGQVACWGRIRGTRDGGGPQVVLVEELRDVIELSHGLFNTHVCAQKRDRSVWCWGEGQAFAWHETLPNGSPTPILVVMPGVEN